MNRLTLRNEKGTAFWSLAGAAYRMTEDSMDQKRLDRLAAYEDTGLEPEEIKRICAALDLAMAERKRQDSLWGDQSGNSPFEWVSILGEEYGELCEAVNETYSGKARHPERGGPETIIKEAVHVAAVAVEIIEAAIQAEHREER